jgi:hypothetical protein
MEPGSHRQIAVAHAVTTESGVYFGVQNVIEARGYYFALTHKAATLENLFGSLAQ